MFKSRLTLMGTALLVLIATVGCGGSGLKSVSGTVTMGGKPLTTGNVAFHRVGGGAMGTASIQSDGSFTVKTGAQKGITPGEYEITVVAFGEMPPATPENLEPIPPRITPDKYASPKTSGFKCTVPLKEALVLKLDAP